jgi:hypothetical protein
VCGCISKPFTSIPPMTSLPSSLADIFLFQIQDGTGIHSLWFKIHILQLVSRPSTKEKGAFIPFDSFISCQHHVLYTGWNMCRPPYKHLSACLSSPQLLICLFDLPLHLLRMVLNSSIGIGTAVSDRDLLIFLWLLDVFLRCII